MPGVPPGSVRLTCMHTRSSHRRKPSVYLVSTIHYVYKITEIATQKYYIGKRSCPVDGLSPLEDLGQEYFTSGIWEKEFKHNPTAFRQEIIAKYRSHRAAAQHESKLLQSHKHHPLCVNGKRYQEEQVPLPIRKQLAQGVVIIHGQIVFDGQSDEWSNASNEVMIHEMTRVETLLKLAKNTPDPRC